MTGLQVINIGAYPNDATGDPIREAFTKINYNFTLFSGTLNPFTPTVPGLVPASGGGTSTTLRADGTWTSIFTGSWTFPTLNSTTVNATNVEANDVTAVTGNIATVGATTVNATTLAAPTGNIIQVNATTVDTNTVTASSQVTIAGAPAYDPASGNIGYYARTAAEIAAAVTPVNYAYEPGWSTRFGVDTSGIIDSTAAVQNALNAAAKGALFSASGGATVIIPSGAILYIAGNLTIPANVTVKGPQSFVGTMTSNSMNAPFQTMGGQLSLASTATVTLSAGTCLDGLLIVQHGLAFPQTNASAYAGTAVTYGGDDCCVQNCMILGFAQGITSSGFQRPKCFHCLMDNQAGISFAGSEDITHVQDVHMWNLGTFYPAVPGVDLQRTGTAFNISADGSGAKLIDCFCFGYNTGFNMSGTGEVGQTLLNCWADSTGNYGTGFNIIGGATDTKLTACQASACSAGYLFSLNSGLKATMTDCNAWGNGGHGILSGSGNAGDIIIRGGYLRNNPNAISYANTGGAGILDVDEVAFDNSNGLTFNVTVATTNVFIGSQNNYGNIAAGTQLIGTPANVGVPSIASAAQLNIPDTGSDFIVTGTTNIGSAVFGWAGREVTLDFNGVLTIGSSTGAYNDIRLSGGASFTTVAGSTLTLKHNGVQWYEVGRAA